MSETTFVYVTYIATTPEKLWEALTSGRFTKQYWGGFEVKSDWQEGSTILYLNPDGEVADEGRIVRYEPYTHLSFTWLPVPDHTFREQVPVVSFTLQPVKEAVKLTLKHEGLLPSDLREESEGFQGYNNGWPAILSNLKSLLETGNAKLFDTMC